MDFKAFQERLRQFAQERDWEQFHSPKNLSMALAGEVGELIEHFQWLTEEQSKEENLSEKQKAAISEELADVAIYILRLSDQLGVDLEKAMETKITQNAEKYPVSLAKGNATKYNRR